MQKLMNRWCGAAIIAAALVGASACSSQHTSAGVRTGPKEVRAATDHGVTSGGQRELSVQEQSSRDWAADVPQTVVDREGRPVGSFRPSALDEAAKASQERQRSDGFTESSELTQEQRWAYYVLAAAEVRDDRGDLVGYFADVYYEREAYADAVKRAKAILDDAVPARP